MNTREVLLGIGASLNQSSPVPLYQQLTAALRSAIESGSLAAGEALPAEPELAKLLGVSRQTANVALSNLARRGLVSRKRGTGSFVAAPFVEQPLGGLYSFIHTLESQGRMPMAQLLGFRLTLDDRASALLTGTETGMVYELKRLRLVDDQPFAVETTYLPATCGQRLPFDRLVKEPLYDLLEEFCGLRVLRAEETLRPVTLERADAQLLGLAAGEPAFLVERLGFAGEQAVELRISLIRGDRYRFRVKLEAEERNLA